MSAVAAFGQRGKILVCPGPAVRDALPAGHVPAAAYLPQEA